MEVFPKENRYIRVTTPLQVFSGLENVPSKILEYAADRGTRVHKFCEQYAYSILFSEIDDDCFEYVQAFINWYDENVDSVVFTEKRLYCDELKITGCADMLCILKDESYNGKPCLIDIKTSSKPSKTWPLQTAAYKYLCEKNGYDVQERFIVHLKKDGKYSCISYGDNSDASKYQKDLSIYASVL